MTAQTEAVELFAFDNSYARLPDRFFKRLAPTPVSAPRLVRMNEKLAWHLGLDPGKLSALEGVEILAGNRVPKTGEPLAMAYAGHQFGGFVPQLGDAAVRSLFTDPSAFDDWAERWSYRLAEEGGEASERRAVMRAANPAFIPRNHLVEEAISAGVSNGDFSPFESLLTVLSMPCEDQPALGRYADPPRPDQVVHQTFCGT